MKKLAIVIPAYKPDFLRQALDSISAQTSRDFALYVYDDASPYDIKAIVGEYDSVLDISYTRFDSNVGSISLVSNWNRCIEQVREEWVWLFSDDDIMEPGCVEAFLATDVDKFDVIHFDMDIIDSEGSVIRKCPPYPDILSAAEFYRLLYSHHIDARMPEFVFRTEKLKKNGFVSFDLAWRSDNATVMQNALGSGILTIHGNEAKVRWRASSSNISSIDYNRERKNDATVCFFNWVYDFFKANGISSPIPTVFQLKTILFEFIYSDRSSFLKESIAAGGKLNYVKVYLWPIYLILIAYRIYYRRFDLK